MAADPETTKARRRPSSKAWCVAIGTIIAAGWLAYVGFVAVRAVAIDLQVFSRWGHQTVEADKRAIDNTILPAIGAYARREGRLPESLDAIVEAGDLASIPDSQAGLWFFYVRPEDFTIGVGDPPHEYPSAYRVIELDDPANPDPDRWRVRDWYHDS